MKNLEQLEKNKRRNKKIMKVFAPIFAVLFIIVIISFATDKEKPLTKAEIELAKKDSIMQERNKLLDRIMIGFEDIAKSKMRDPDSYEKIESTYTKSDTLNIVRMYLKFRGNNAFGGKAITTIVADYNIKGDDLQIVNQFSE